MKKHTNFGDEIYPKTKGKSYWMGIVLPLVLIIGGLAMLKVPYPETVLEFMFQSAGIITMMFVGSIFMDENL